MTLVRKANVVVALAAAGLASILVGTTSASPANRVHGLHQFRSPSGNIGCEILKKYVRCDIETRDWKPPAAPKSCHLDYGQGLLVGAKGKGAFVCAGDTALDPHATKLGYGHSIRDGRMSCVIKVTGMTCKNRRTGHGFFISKENYRRF